MIDLPSPNFEDRKDLIRFIIIHSTGSNNLAKALDYLIFSKAPNRVSSHYLIDRDGSVYRLVPEDKTAWHAGLSDWNGYAKSKGLNSLNHSSIGIELQMKSLSYDSKSGEGCMFEQPTDNQLNACTQLCKQIITRHSILPVNVLRHRDVSPGRKFDPDLNFPWALFKKGLERE